MEVPLDLALYGKKKQKKHVLSISVKTTKKNDRFVFQAPSLPLILILNHFASGAKLS